MAPRVDSRATPSDGVSQNQRVSLSHLSVRLRMAASASGALISDAMRKMATTEL